MPNKIFNFSIGMLFGVGISNWIYISRHWLYQKFHFIRWLYRKERWWVLYLPLFSLFFGLLAVLPSLLFSLKMVPGSFPRSPWANLFFFHAFIESLPGRIPAKWDYFLSLSGEALAVFLCGGIVFLYIAIIVKSNKKINTLKKQFREEEKLLGK